MSGCGVALVLLLDVSGSIDGSAWAALRDGHAAAFRAPAIQRAIARDGLAVAAIQFDDEVHPVLSWRVLHSAGDAAGMADALGAMARRGSGDTHTGSAVVAALGALREAPCGDVQVVDVVTDGPANGGVPLAVARAAAEAEGVRINGLAVRTRADDPAGVLRAQLVTPGGFALEAAGWGDFADAMRRKLTMEIGALHE